MGDREAEQNRGDDLLLLEEVAALTRQSVSTIRLAAPQRPGTPRIPARPTSGFQAGRGRGMDRPAREGAAVSAHNCNPSFGLLGVPVPGMRAQDAASVHSAGRRARHRRPGVQVLPREWIDGIPVTGGRSLVGGPGLQCRSGAIRRCCGIGGTGSPCGKIARAMRISLGTVSYYVGLGIPYYDPYYDSDRPIPDDLLTESERRERTD